MPENREVRRPPLNIRLRAAFRRTFWPSKFRQWCWLLAEEFTPADLHQVWKTARERREPKEDF